MSFCFGFYSTQQKVSGPWPRLLDTHYTLTNNSIAAYLMYLWWQAALSGSLLQTPIPALRVEGIYHNTLISEQTVFTASKETVQVSLQNCPFCHQSGHICGQHDFCTQCNACIRDVPQICPTTLSSDSGLAVSPQHYHSSCPCNLFSNGIPILQQEESWQQDAWVGFPACSVAIQDSAGLWSHLLSLPVPRSIHIHGEQGQPFPTADMWQGGLQKLYNSDFDI